MIYQKIEPNSYSANDLLSLLKKSHVLLEVHFDTFDFTCSVTSYAYTTKGLYVYQPAHCLEKLGKYGSEKVVVERSTDWTKIFLSGDASISIDRESYFHCEYSNDLTQIKILLSQLEESPCETELYLSDDYNNFYGPLECDFIEWWIKNHKGYHTDTISVQIENFKITENGTVLDYIGENAAIIKVPSGVKRIGTGALRFCKAKQIILPEGITFIEDDAFKQSDLEQVNIPASVIRIGYSAFSFCGNLKNIQIPPSVKEIYSYTFDGCHMLKFVSLPDSIEIIGHRAFYDCRNLESIQIPQHIKLIDSEAFSGCSKLNNISLPESLDIIGRKAFSGCSNLGQVSLSRRTSVGFAAFEGCSPMIEMLSSSFLISKGKLLEASHFLKGDVQVPNSVRTLAADPNRGILGGSKTLYDNTQIRTLILPKGIIKAEKWTLPRNLEYLIIQPSKRNFWCDDDILDNSKAKIIFHFGRDLVMKSLYRWCDEPLIFVSFSTDKVLHYSQKACMSDNARRYRVIISNTNNIKKIVEEYHLSAIAVIMNYLTDIFGCNLLLDR